MTETFPAMLELVTVIPSFVIGLLYIRAACLVLELRSNRIYALCHCLNVTANILANRFGLPMALRAFVINPSTTVIMPIAYSRGPLRSRIVRVLALCLILLPTEAASSSVYMLLGHGPYFSVIDASNYVDIALTYCVTILLGALSLELLVFLYRRVDRRADANLEPSILTCMGACYALSLLTYTRLGSTARQSMLVLASIGASVLFDVAYALIALAIARKDATIRRMLADEAAIMRQMRHVTRIIERSSVTCRGMRQLRHDLANQLDIITKLAESGHIREANQHLGSMRERICQLTEDES